jgi:DNA-binding NtrC family response regulator
MPKLIECVRRVIVVDDESDICRQLREAFEAKRWEVRVCEDGVAAEHEVTAFDPTVVVLDLRMPKKGGLEVLDFIRAARPWTQVVILTGHGTEEDAIRCVNKHAFRFLQKPIPPRQVVEAAEEAIQEVPEPVRAFQSWYYSLPDHDKVVYKTASGERVTAARLFDEVQRRTRTGREFLENVMAVAVELITERL